MKIYIIERKLKGKWHPLAFISKNGNMIVEDKSIGAAFQVYPAIGQTKNIIDKILEIAEETFPDDKFRISVYERMVL